MTLKEDENGTNQLPGLTPELVAELEKDHSKVAQLNELQLRQLLEDEEIPGTLPAAAAPAQQPIAAPTAAAAPVIPAPVKEEKPAPDFVEGDEYRKKTDALNVARQEVAKRERELEAARKLAGDNQVRAEALKNLKRKGLDEEGYIESVEERLQRLEDENRSLRESNAAALGSSVSSLESERAKAAVTREFLEIETFQMASSRFGVNLRTERPIKDIDGDIARLEGLLGKDNVLKMQTDKAYREQMSTQGYSLPPEWEKWNTVMKLHQFKTGKNALGAAYPTYDSAFVDFSRESGFLKKAVTEAQLDASRETAEKLIQSSNETPLLPAESGAGGISHTTPSSKWTMATAKAWMESHRTPKTAEERDTQYEILAWLEQQPD